MEAKIALVTLELIEALQNNNLEITKEKIEFLNNNIDKIDNIDDLIMSGDGNFSLDHESFNYFLDNALFFKSSDLYKFRRKVRRLLIENNSDKMKNFLLDIINNQNVDELIKMKTFYEDLILLSNQINNTETFKLVKDYIESQVK